MTKFKSNMLLASITLLATMYVSTGTLAPYAASIPQSNHIQLIVTEPCKYLLNGDAYHFLATYWMLDGQPKENWDFSVVLRRMLYPVISYPAMKIIDTSDAIQIPFQFKGWNQNPRIVEIATQLQGWYYGGLLTNFIIHLGSFLFFTKYIKKRFGINAGITSGWLLAVYPGISYWVGQPFLYAAIVPASLLVCVFLWRISDNISTFDTISSFFFIGILLLSHDSLAILGVSCVVLLLIQKRWRIFPAAVLFLVLPGLIVTFFQFYYFRIAFQNDNTNAYGNILKAYINLNGRSFLGNAGDFPNILIHNFLFSGFLFIPSVFICFVGANFLRTSKSMISSVEGAIIVSFLGLCVFNNMAPSYEGWQMRGEWIARLYQPIFIAFVSYISRHYQIFKGENRKSKHNSCSKTYGMMTLFLILGVLGNAVTVYGILWNSKITDSIYHEFYRHSPKGTLIQTLQTFGNRPLGFCNTDMTPKNGVVGNRWEYEKPTIY